MNSFHLSQMTQMTHLMTHHWRQGPSTFSVLGLFSTPFFTATLPTLAGFIIVSFSLPNNFLLQEPQVTANSSETPPPMICMKNKTRLIYTKAAQNFTTCPGQSLPAKGNKKKPSWAGTN